MNRMKHPPFIKIVQTDKVEWRADKALVPRTIRASLIGIAMILMPWKK